MLEISISIPNCESLECTYFDGYEALSELFYFQIGCNSPAPLDAHALLGMPVTITLEIAQPRKWHGILQRIEHVETQHRSQWHYRLRVVPKCWTLTQQWGSRIFHQLSADDVVQRLLIENNCRWFDVSRLNNLAKKKHVQYRENQWHFLCRVLEKQGIFFFFNHAAEDYTLIFSNQHHQLPEHYVSPFLFDNVTCQYNTIAEGITLQDYNFKTPKNSLCVGADKKGFYKYAAGFETMVEGRQKLNIAERRLRSSKLIFEWDSETVIWQVGHCYNEQYFITAVRHHAYLDERGFHYYNRVKAIPNTVHYCPPRKHATHRIGHVESATVRGSTAIQHVNQWGEITVQHDWEPNIALESKARVMQWWAGKHWGAQFFPRKDEEVLVAYRNGDPAQPLVLGAMYNGKHLSPFAFAPAYHLAGITFPGMALTFDEAPDHEQLKWRSNGQLNIKVGNNLNIKTGSENIEITHGNMIIRAKKAWKIQAAKAIKLQVGDSYLLIEKNKITMSAKTIHLN